MARRAAILPGGWTAIVIADESDEGKPPLALRLAESFEVGSLVPSEGGPRPMKRLIGDADVEAAVKRAMQRFTSMNVDSVAIEWASAKGSQRHTLALALQVACAAEGIAWSYVKRWRIWDTYDHRQWVARRIEEDFRGWPEPSYTVIRDCGAMLLETIAPSRPAQLPPLPKEVTDARESSDAQIAEPSNVATEGETKTEDVHQQRRDAPAVRTPAGASFDEPRLAGIDPGSGHLGLVIAAPGTTKPLRLVLAQTFPVGERVLLKKPRKIQRGDETITLTTRHSLTQEMVESLTAKIVGTLLEHGVTRLAIEHVEAVHIAANSASQASSIATSLIRTSWLDTLIGERARAAGIQVERVKGPTWRAAVAGRKRKGGAGAELIPGAVMAGIEGWPTASDPHERDAAGVCLWLAMPAHEAPAPRPRQPKAEGPRKRAPKPAGSPLPPSYYVRLERLRKSTAEKRAATGCTCGNNRRGRHRSGCPLGHRNGELSAAKTPERSGDDGR